MNRIALVSLASLFALSACSGGGFSPSTSPGTGVRSDAAFAVQPYTVPVTTRADIDAAQTGATHSSAAEASSRSVKYAGGPPTIFSLLDLIDAQKFQANDQINLAVIGVDAMSAGTAYPLVAYSSEVMIDILNFKTSALELGGANIPAIAYDGLRLKIDPSNSNVVVNGKTYPVAFGSYVRMQGRTFVPSGTATEADMDFAMAFGTSSPTVQLLIDFDAYDSVNLVNNVAQIAPKLHGAVYAQSGVINGTVLNKNKMPVSGATVQALNSDGSVAATAPSGNDGSFELHGIAGGSYTIVVLNTFVNDAGITLTAQNNDSSTPGSVQVNVPPGYKLNVGNIRD